LKLQHKLSTSMKQPVLSYQQILRQYGLSPTQLKDYVYCGNMDIKPWELYISVITLQICELLDVIVPILKKTEASFKLIKDEKAHYGLNAGDYGEAQIGKVVVLYPKTKTEMLMLITAINLVTQKFNGPLCPTAQRIGKVLYADKSAFIKAIKNQVEKRYIRRKRNRLLGKYYVPVSIIKTSFKGTAYKAVSLRKLSFKTCLIKEGNPFALDDHWGRTIKDRLLWQKKVLLDLRDDITTPSFYDYFEENEYSYLVIQYVEGNNLFDVVRTMYGDQNWNEISNKQQQTLLNYFLNVLDIVDTLHKKGYVQRDISDSNFLIMGDGRLCIIDFELSYNVITKEPEHPFPLGSIGYASPEQLRMECPDYKADIYSLGALLCFILTGIPPKHFITGDKKKMGLKLSNLLHDSRLTSVIIRCLAQNPAERPELLQLKIATQTFIHTIKQEL